MQQLNLPQKRKSNFFLWTAIGLIILGLAFLAAFAFAYKFYETSRKVIEADPPESFFESVKDITSSQRKILRGEEEGRINILLLGLAGENYPGENLTDSIIIASINPKTYQTAMLSIPRDLYVQIPGTKNYTKINALYARGYDKHGRSTEGIEDLKKALSEIAGLDIHYYAALDFDGFRQVIDALGGIKIQVPKDIEDERYPGPNYSYQTFEIEEGLHALDGQTALKYARTRHDEGGDFGRAFRQQQILKAARQKAFSLKTLMNVPAVNNILNALGDHFRTDVPLDEVESFLKMTEKIDAHTTIGEVLDAGRPDSLLAVSHVYLGHVRAYTLIPRIGEYGEIHELASNIFELELIERKKNAVKEEEARVLILNRSKTASLGKKLENLLGKIGFDAEAAETNSRKTGLVGNTIIYDVSKTKPFSAEDISKKLGARVSQEAPDDIYSVCREADLCLVAGFDLAEQVDYEENSLEELEEGYDKKAVDEKEYIELLKKGSSQRF